MTRQELIDLLTFHGWLKGWPPGDVPDIALEVAKKAYAQFHKINVADIEQHMQLPRCALPDNLPMAAKLCKWDRQPITVAIAGSLPGIDDAAHEAAVMQACGFWMAVAGLDIRFTDDPARASIVMTAGVIDQSGGTLAWSELPCGGQARLTQKYDTRENWVLSETPSNGIDFVRVCCHELGHALGMGHITAGNLLAPTYSPRIRRPQPGDIEEMRSRYGQPVPTPDPTPDPIPTPTPGGGNMGDIFKKLFDAILAAIGPKFIEMLGPLIIKWITDWIGKNANAVNAAGLDAGKLQVLFAKAQDDLRSDMQALVAQALQAQTP